jgi:hypothetical protein
VYQYAAEINAVEILGVIKRFLASNIMLICDDLGSDIIKETDAEFWRGVFILLRSDRFVFDEQDSRDLSDLSWQIWSQGGKNVSTFYVLVNKQVLPYLSGESALCFGLCLNDPKYDSAGYKEAAISLRNRCARALGNQSRFDLLVRYCDEDVEEEIPKLSPTILFDALCYMSDDTQNVSELEKKFKNEVDELNAKHQGEIEELKQRIEELETERKRESDTMQNTLMKVFASHQAHHN